MRKLKFNVKEPNNKIYTIEFVTDRDVDSTVDQYTRHRGDIVMELISNEETEEKESLSRIS